MSKAKILVQLDENHASKLLGELAKEMEKLGKKMPKIMARVQNVVIRGMRTEVSKVIRAEYAAPAKEVAKTMSITKASSRNQFAALHMRGRMAVELVHYGAKQGKKGVSIKVLKSSKKAPIKSGGKLDILSTLKRGASATFIAKQHVLGRVKGKDHPIMLWGPSFLSVLNRKEVVSALQNESDLRFSKDFLKQFNYELSKLS